MNPHPIQIAILDDHELFRRGLALLLDTVEGFEVIDATGAEDGAWPEVDVVLIDGTAPGEVGCTAVKAASPEVRVLMLIAPHEEPDIFAALAAGASGFVNKDASLEELVNGIQVVADGQSLISSAIAARLVDGLGSADGRVGVRRTLTARETEVLRLVAQGMSNRAIAQRLAISENTVKNHVRSLLDKLDMHSRTEAAMYAVRRGIVTI